MAWYSYTYAATVSPERIAANPQAARELLQTKEENACTVFASSRRGGLLYMIGNILDCSSVERDLYLLEDQAVLTGDALQRQHALLSSLLTAIDRDPQIVVEATKSPYRPTGTFDVAGFEPRPYVMVYSPDTTIENGWVYHHTQEEVRRLAATARCSPEPQPEHDEDGTSLEYAFAFLKSHAALLQSAMERKLGVVYAEMNT
jgi:hypothetical protein